MFKIKKIKDLLARPNSRVLVGNFTYLSILQILNYLLPLITLPYLTRVIGIEMFGILSIASSIIIYFQAFVDFGFDFSATRDIANCQNDKVAISKIYCTVTVVKLIFMVISLLILLILIMLLPYLKQHFLIIFLTFLYLPGRVLFPEWFFQGMEKMLYVTILNVISKVLFTVLIFFVIKTQKDYIFQPILVAAGYLLSGIVSIFIIYYHFGVRLYWPTIIEIRKAIKGSRDLFLNMLFPSLYNSLSTLLLGYWWGNSAAGILDASKKVINLSEQAITVLSRTFFPYLAKNIRKHHIYVKISLSVSIVMMVFFILGADYIVKFLFAPEFTEAKNIIRILAITPVIISLINAYGTNYLILVHEEKLLRNITLFSSLVGFVVALVLVYNFKTVGAALTLNISRGLIAGLCVYYARRIQLEPIKYTLKIRNI